MQTAYKQELRLLGSRGRVIWGVVLIAVLAYLPTVLENRAAFGYAFSETQLLGVGLPQVNLALVAIIAAVALNLLIGYTGLLSMGHAAFFAVGAIVAAVLGVQHDVPFPLIILIAGLAGAAVGAIVGLPSLRVRGLYLLLSTLALHFIAAFVFLEYQERNYGPSGINFDPPELFGIVLDNDRSWYFLLVVLCGLVLLLSRNLLHMRQGRAMVAVRDHEAAAASLGVDVGMHRIKVFALTSFFTSAAGALYVYHLGNTSADVYTLEFVINYFAIIIIGGMGSLLGAVLGVILWQLLPEALNTFSASVDPATPVLGDLLGKYQGQTVSLILGLLVILIMILRPAGLYGVWLAAKRGILRWPFSA